VCPSGEISGAKPSTEKTGSREQQGDMGTEGLRKEERG